MGLLKLADVAWWKWGKRYMLTLTIGMTCMVLGFIFRIVYLHSPNSLGLYILTTLFVLLSPCAFLATDYIILNKMALSLDPKIGRTALFISPTKIVRIFITSDVITFLLQATGGGMSVQPSSATAGKNIALIGLILQLLSFVLFTILLLVFGWRVEANNPLEWHRSVISSGKNMRVLFFAVCFTCIGVIIRSAFRIAEYSGGYTGFVAIHEGYFYLLDALPLWISMSTYCFIWPTRYISEPAPETKVEFQAPKTNQDMELNTGNYELSNYRT